MIVLWLIDAGLTLLRALLSLFPTLPTYTLPNAPSLNVPVPYLTRGQIANLNAWLAVALPVGLLLVGGRMLQWAYRLIPLKAT